MCIAETLCEHTILLHSVGVNTRHIQMVCVPVAYTAGINEQGCHVIK